jgi:hypothetical protein
MTLRAHCRLHCELCRVRIRFALTAKFSGKNRDKFGAIRKQTNAKADANQSKKGALQGALLSVSRIRGKLNRSD